MGFAPGLNNYRATAGFTPIANPPVSTGGRQTFIASPSPQHTAITARPASQEDLQQAILDQSLGSNSISGVAGVIDGNVTAVSPKNSGDGVVTGNGFSFPPKKSGVDVATGSVFLPPSRNPGDGAVPVNVISQPLKNLTFDGVAGSTFSQPPKNSGDDVIPIDISQPPANLTFGGVAGNAFSQPLKNSADDVVNIFATALRNLNN
jgi:hypothetical protein